MRKHFPFAQAIARVTAGYHFPDPCNGYRGSERVFAEKKITGTFVESDLVFGDFFVALMVKQADQFVTVRCMVIVEHAVNDECVYYWQGVVYS